MSPHLTHFPPLLSSFFSPPPSPFHSSSPSLSPSNRTFAHLLFHPSPLSPPLSPPAPPSQGHRPAPAVQEHITLAQQPVLRVRRRRSGAGAASVSAVPLSDGHMSVAKLGARADLVNLGDVEAGVYRSKCRDRVSERTDTVSSLFLQVPSPPLLTFLP